MSVRLDKNRELGRAVVGADLNQNRGAANTHRGDRRLDTHVAVLRGLSRNERDRALNQTHERGVRRSVWIVDHLVQHHARIRSHAECAAIDESHADRGVGPGLDHVAFLNGVADMQLDGHAIADTGGAAG